MDAGSLAELLKGAVSGGSPGEMVAGVVTLPLDLAQLVIGKADELAELFIKTITDAGYELVKVAVPGGD